MINAMNNMKSYIPCCLLALAAAASIVSCKENEVYETSVTRDIQMTRDGEPWNIYYGTTNRPLFIYKSNGEFVGNYSTSYRFSLEDGDYRIFATDQADLITPPTNINDQIIEQDPETKQTFAISNSVAYKAGDPVSLALLTRTGTLRLKAMDEKADKSYTRLRATYTTTVHAYSVANNSVVTGEPYDLVREKETTGGGVGYTEDAILIASPENPLNVRIDYLDDNDNIVQSKEFADPIAVTANEITEVTFNLNDPNEQVIINYQVAVGNPDWNNGTVYPQIPVDVPDGFTYIEPDGDLAATFKEQMADESIDEIRIFLKAGTRYTLATAATRITKPVHILGQVPGFGQTAAQVATYNFSIGGDIDHITFQNVQLSSQDRFFNLDTTPFSVGSITFSGCTFNTWRGTLWYQNPRKDEIQSVGTFTVESCFFNNYSGGTTPLVGGCNRSTNVANISNIVLSNNVIIGTNFGTNASNTALIGNLASINVPLTVNIEGNTIIDTRSAGSTCIYFTIDGAKAPSTALTVKNNRFSGAVSGKGTLFSLGAYTSIEVSGNTRTAGYTMQSWGIDEPAETNQTYEDLLNQSKS